MFDHETFRNLNDELKYELYKDLNENVTYFKRIIENLTVSTKDEEKKNLLIKKILKTRAIRKLQKTNLKMNGAGLKFGAEIRTNEPKISKKARIKPRNQNTSNQYSRRKIRPTTKTFTFTTRRRIFWPITGRLNC